MKKRRQSKKSKKVDAATRSPFDHRWMMTCEEVVFQHGMISQREYMLSHRLFGTWYQHRVRYTVAGIAVIGVDQLFQYWKRHFARVQRMKEASGGNPPEPEDRELMV